MNITVLGDNVEEEEEVFLLQLSNLSHAVVDSYQVSGTITDNDQVCVSLSGQPTNTIRCIGEDLTLSVVASGSSLGSNATQYQWFKDGQILSGQESAQLNLLAIDQNAAGSYHCQVSNHCNQLSSDQAIVQVDAPPAALGSLSGPSQTCSDSSVTFSVAQLAGAASYVWSLPAGSVLQEDQGNSISVTLSQSGSVSVYASNQCGASASVSRQIEVFAPVADAAAGSDQVVPEDELVVLQANAAQVGQGSWSIESGPSLALSQFSDSADANANFSPAGGAGTYQLNWTLSNGTCPSSSDQLTVRVRTTADLAVQMSVDRAQPSVGELIQLSLSVVNHGPNPASGVVLSLPLPQALELLQSSGSGYDRQSGQWLPGDLSANGSSQLVLSLRLTATQQVNLLAELSHSDAYDPDSIPGNGQGEDDSASLSLTPQGFLVLSDQLLRVLAARPEVDSYDDDLISPAEASAVTELNLDGTRIEDYSGLNLFANLLSLSLRNNGLLRLPQMSDLSQLQNLDCSNNWLISLQDEDDQFSLPGNLEVLVAQDNQLTEVSEELSQLQGLTTLRLTENQITKVSPNLGNLSLLQILDLEANQLSELPSSTGNLEHLLELHLAKNRLSQLPDLSHLQQLWLLSCSHNRLSQLPDLSNSPLKLLDLHQNLLIDVSNIASHPTLGNDTSDQILLQNNWLTSAVSGPSNLDLANSKQRCNLDLHHPRQLRQRVQPATRLEQPGHKLATPRLGLASRDSSP